MALSDYLVNWLSCSTVILEFNKTCIALELNSTVGDSMIY